MCTSVFGALARAAAVLTPFTAVSSVCFEQVTEVKFICVLG